MGAALLFIDSKITGLCPILPMPCMDLAALPGRLARTLCGRCCSLLPASFPYGESLSYFPSPAKSSVWPHRKTTVSRRSCSSGNDGTLSKRLALCSCSSVRRPVAALSRQSVAALFGSTAATLKGQPAAALIRQQKSPALRSVSSLPDAGQIFISFLRYCIWQSPVLQQVLRSGRILLSYRPS